MKHLPCGTPAEYNEGWDAFYCPRCNVWLDETCGSCAGNPCFYQCWKRPVFPMREGHPVDNEFIMPKKEEK